jgi:hypothetical protein
MTTKNVHKTSRSFSSSTSQSSNDLSSNEICWFFRLPLEILQVITDFLEIKDVLSLNQTCQTFYTVLNDNNFWIHRIHSQFAPSIAQLYTFDLFQKPEIIETYNEIRSSGFTHVQTENELDRLAINSATHYNDEAIEKRHAKMYVSKEDFLDQVEFYQFNKPNNYSDIPLMKLIYFYLIDRKRCAAIDMNVIHHDEHQQLVEENDVDSLTGRIINLQNIYWFEITGRLEQKIMPGKYEISWRIKGALYCNFIWGETEFIVVPQHGKLLNYKMSADDFRYRLVEHENHWFIVKIGQIIIYEPSIVLVAVRNQNDTSWKSHLSWDCIELTLVP